MVQLLMSSSRAGKIVIHRVKLGILMFFACDELISVHNCIQRVVILGHDHEPALYFFKCGFIGNF